MSCMTGYFYTTGYISFFIFQKHRIPVHSIPCLEQWLFQKERTPLAQKWHEDAGNKLGLLVKLGKEILDRQ